jgi:uncharacterized protein YndB with AHSA1/START domain
MSARREVVVEAWLAAPPARVWRILSDHERMPKWMPVREVVRRRPGTPDPDGVGAVRTIKSGGLVFDEEIVGWKPGERLEYRVTAGAPLRDHRGVVRLAAEGDGTRLVWTVGFRPWIPGTGPLVERAVRRLLEGGVRGLERRLAGPWPPPRAGA